MSVLVGAELDQLVERHVRQVRLIARRLARVQPVWITRGELESAGLLALLNVAARYDPERDCLPCTFFEKRIWGAMRDCIRESVGRKGRPRAQPLSLSGFPHLVSPELSPEDRLNQQETARDLLAAIARLPERERTVMTFSFEGYKNREIAAFCGVTEGRISQHKTAALAKLRTMLSSSPSAEGRLQRAQAA